MKSKQIFRTEKTYKPSSTKANARYRGVTDLNQYSNFVLESAHDMTLLSHIMTGNASTNVPGHEKAVTDNYVALFNGGVSPVMYDSFTASTLMKVNKKSKLKTPADLTTWESIGNCSVSAITGGYRLSSPGTASSCGIRTPITVYSGQILSLRLRAKTAQALNDFVIGSENLNDIGSLKKFPIKASSYGYFVDYRLYCKNHETIYINLYVHQTPTSVVASSVELLNIEFCYGEELPVSLIPLNGDLKTDLNQMRETLNFLKN